MVKMKPVIIWDIDGPLNPFLSPKVAYNPNFIHWGSDWNTGWFDVVDHREWIRELLKLPVDMLWGSNWQEDCARIGMLFDFPEDTPWVPLTIPRVDDTWKLDSVKQYVDANHKTAPVIWLDDEIGPRGERWAEERGDVLLVKCDPRTGWTFEEKEQMLVFLNKYL